MQQECFSFTVRQLNIQQNCKKSPNPEVYLAQEVPNLYLLSVVASVQFFQ